MDEEDERNVAWILAMPPAEMRRWVLSAQRVYRLQAPDALLFLHFSLFHDGTCAKRLIGIEDGVLALLDDLVVTDVCSFTEKSLCALWLSLAGLLSTQEAEACLKQTSCPPGALHACALFHARIAGYVDFAVGARGNVLGESLRVLGDIQSLLQAPVLFSALLPALLLHPSVLEHCKTFVLGHLVEREPKESVLDFWRSQTWERSDVEQICGTLAHAKDLAGLEPLLARVSLYPDLAKRIVKAAGGRWPCLLVSRSTSASLPTLLTPDLVSKSNLLCQFGRWPVAGGTCVPVETLMSLLEMALCQKAYALAYYLLSLLPDNLSAEKDSTGAENEGEPLLEWLKDLIRRTLDSADTGPSAQDGESRERSDAAGNATVFLQAALPVLSSRFSPSAWVTWLSELERDEALLSVLSAQPESASWVIPANVVSSELGMHTTELEFVRCLFLVVDSTEVSRELKAEKYRQLFFQGLEDNNRELLELLITIKKSDAPSYVSLTEERVLDALCDHPCAVPPEMVAEVSRCVLALLHDPVELQSTPVSTQTALLRWASRWAGEEVLCSFVVALEASGVDIDVDMAVEHALFNPHDVVDVLASLPVRDKPAVEVARLTGEGLHVQKLVELLQNGRLDVKGNLRDAIDVLEACGDLASATELYLALLDRELHESRPASELLRVCDAGALSEDGEEPFADAQAVCRDLGEVVVLPDGAWPRESLLCLLERGHTGLAFELRYRCIEEIGCVDILTPDVLLELTSRGALDSPKSLRALIDTYDWREGLRVFRCARVAKSLRAAGHETLVEANAANWLRVSRRASLEAQRDFYETHQEILWQLVRRGALSSVELLLEREVFLRAYSASWDPAAPPCILFALACEEGRLEAVELLLKHPATVVDTLDNWPLREAAARGHKSIVDVLMADGRADPSDGGDYGVRWAAMHNHPGVVDVLLRDPRVDPANQSGYGLVKWCHFGPKKLGKLLKHNRLAFPPEERNLLEYTARRGYWDVVALLVDDGRVPVCEPFLEVIASSPSGLASRALPALWRALGDAENLEHLLAGVVRAGMYTQLAELLDARAVQKLRGRLAAVLSKVAAVSERTSPWTQYRDCALLLAKLASFWRKEMRPLVPLLWRIESEEGWAVLRVDTAHQRIDVACTEDVKDSASLIGICVGCADTCIPRALCRSLSQSLVDEGWSICAVASDGQQHSASSQNDWQDPEPNSLTPDGTTQNLQGGEKSPLSTERPPDNRSFSQNTQGVEKAPSSTEESPDDQTSLEPLLSQSARTPGGGPSGIIAKRRLSVLKSVEDEIEPPQSSSPRRPPRVTPTSSEEGPSSSTQEQNHGVTPTSSEEGPSPSTQEQNHGATISDRKPPTSRKGVATSLAEERESFERELSALPADAHCRILAIRDKALSCPEVVDELRKLLQKFTVKQLKEAAKKCGVRPGASAKAGLIDKLLGGRG